jgi:hypothetical protein
MPRIAMFPARIFDLYKQLRKKVSELVREDSLRVIWAYTQYLQVVPVVN